MAEHGEWNRKGATLSDVTAHKEYGVSRDFIVKGIRAGKLEYREGSIWGNPYLRVLRSQLELYIMLPHIPGIALASSLDSVICSLLSQRFSSRARLPRTGCRLSLSNYRLRQSNTLEAPRKGK